jgi:hypothetical protein
MAPDMCAGMGFFALVTQFMASPMLGSGEDLMKPTLEWAGSESRRVLDELWYILGIRTHARAFLS